uniref:Uncharacterized protein n=1 Tax=Bionectria ochroleuca TaxID=29856 RepID=A0A0B7KF42_BIOOC
MCGQDLEAEAPRVFGDDFPWHLGVFDVHNHIGELAPLADRIPRMRSRGTPMVLARAVRRRRRVADLLAAGD